MPVFSSEQEAIETHRHYHIDTHNENKFHPGYYGWTRIQQFLDWMPDTQPLILGVGCNSGGLEHTIMKYKIGSVVYGIDVQQEMVRRAVQKGVLARVAQAEQLPFKDDFFDIVLYSEVLEHIYNPSKVMKEGIRVLRPGGLIMGSVPHPCGKNTIKRKIEQHAYHMRVFNRAMLRKALSKLDNVEIVDIHFTPSYVELSEIKEPQWYAFKGEK